MAGIWIPTVAGKACLAELDRIAEKRTARNTSDEPVAEIIADLGSDEFMARKRGRDALQTVFDDQARPRNRAAHALPFLAALAAGDDVADQHELINEIGMIIEQSMRATPLHERIREAALASTKWLQIVARRGSPEVKELLSAAGRAVVSPSEETGNEVYAERQRFIESDARFRHPYGFDEAALRSRPEVWVPSVAGRPAYYESILIGGPDHAALRSFVNGCYKIFWDDEEDARRDARLAISIALRDGALACASRLAPAMLPFLAAFAAAEDVPDRHKLIGLVGEAVMHSLNARSELHDRVLHAARASSKWLHEAATTLPPPASRLALAIDRVAHDASPANDRALRDALMALMVAFPGGP